VQILVGVVVFTLQPFWCASWRVYYFLNQQPDTVFVFVLSRVNSKPTHMSDV